MQTDDLVIRVLPLGGVWETIGADRLAGITPEGFTASANDWGPDTASFDIRRDPGAPHLDLGAFTPLEADVAGELVWSGRTIDAPTRDGVDPVINVQAQGWQYHLDDDVYAKAYVHTLISEWRDVRTFPDTDLSLTGFTSAWQVNIDQGVLHMGIPTNSTVPTYWAAAALDLGPTATAKRIVITAKGGGRTNLALYLQGSNVQASGGEVSQVRQALTMPTSDTVYSLTLASPCRYVGILLANDSGGAMLGDDNSWVQIKSIQVFGSTAYESGNASILKASDVVKDAAKTAPLITDISQVQATSFNVPDLHFEATPQTPREAITAVNALHNYITKVDVDRRLVFAPRPTAPLYEIGAWGGADFQDASAGSGTDVYNRVLVTGAGPDGTPLIAPRYSAQQAGGVAVIYEQSVGWSAGGSATPADILTSLIYPLPAGLPVLIALTPGVPAANTAYPAFGNPGQTITFTVGNQGFAGRSGYGDYITFTIDPTLTDTQYVLWTPQAAHTDSLEVRIDRAPTSKTGGVVVDVYRGVTIPDRVGFQRTKVLPVNAALTTAVANQLGDVYLAAHKTQPLKGNIDAVPTGVRRVAGGDVHPAHLLRETGQRIRLSHRTDPDTGGQGRDGLIATVTYTHDERRASIAIDEDRRNFDVLLARFAAVSPAA